MITAKAEARLHSFGSACHVVVGNQGSDGEALVALALEELDRLEKKFSAFLPDSVISQINRSAGTGCPVPVDAEARSLFEYVSALWSQSNHLFDPSTRLLLECYDTDGRLRASAAQLQDMLSLVGWQHLQVDEQGAQLMHKGMLIDLNSCIRPYAIDCVIRLLGREGATNALVEMDQDSASIGRQPDGANWLFGFRHPAGNRTAIARLKLNDRGFTMRGDFEKRTTQNGENFGRGLSPVDGQAVPGLLSVGVMADSCLSACAAASIARLKTEQAAMQWLESLELPWLAIDRQLECHGPLAPKARG